MACLMIRNALAIQALMAVAVLVRSNLAFVAVAVGLVYAIRTVRGRTSTPFLVG